MMHTIEAVFLAPLTVILSIYIIFIGIILYDRTAVDNALEGALIRGSEQPEMKNEELLRYVEDEFMRLLSGRLIMASGKLEVKISYDSISGEYKGNVNLPKLPALTSSSSSISTALQSSAKAARLRRSKICRAVSALKNKSETKGE